MMKYDIVTMPKASKSQRVGVMYAVLNNWSHKLVQRVHRGQGRCREGGLHGNPMNPLIIGIINTIQYDT